MDTILYTVFVYGTLKNGEPNYYVFDTAQDGYYEFVGNAKLTEKYPLIIATPYNVPFLLYEPGVGYFVQGEIYKVDEKVLEKLDELEDHPNFYVREQHDAIMMDKEGEKLVKAWVYFIKQFREDLLELPMYENYSSEGDHGLEYVPSENVTLEDLNRMILKQRY